MMMGYFDATEFAWADVRKYRRRLALYLLITGALAGIKALWIKDLAWWIFLTIAGLGALYFVIRIRIAVGRYRRVEEYYSGLLSSSKEDDTLAGE